MALPSQEPNVSVKKTLENNWDNTNTSANSDPKFHTGIYDENADEPQVSVTPVSETSIEGGDTGFTYIAPGSGEGGQVRDGLLDVGCWADRNDAESVGSDFPKLLTYEFRREVVRILMNNQKSVTGLETIGPSDSDLIVEDDRDPVVFHRIQTLTYSYDNEP